MSKETEKIVDSIVGVIESKCQDLREDELLQVLNMVNYRCKNMLEEIEEPTDEQLEVHRQQLLQPYH